ncbi:MAG: preprotein translocase subunit SecY [Clostridia bacterium]|nr:preprotein translocase subunit SecY [Clostridia bacterium]
MFKTIKQAWKIPELRSKILFTLFIVLLYRIGAAMPVPFINYDYATSVANMWAENSIFAYFNAFSSNAFGNATLFALGVSPYITAQIVIQLLCVAIPQLEKLSKEGESGRKKIEKITRYLTVGLAIVTAIGYYTILKANFGAGFFIYSEGFAGVFSEIVIIASYTAGACLVMWLGEKIDEQGIGNGISMLLFANIIAGLPTTIYNFISTFQTAEKSTAVLIVYGVLTAVIALASIVFVVYMSDAERRIPIQYAKRTVGRKMYGGQSSNLPIKLNMSGVMPIIFASTIVSLPMTIIALCGGQKHSFWGKIYDALSSDSIIYAIVLFVLIIAFAYFYTAISFNPVEVSNNIMQNGGSIPGIRPGRPTAAYIKKVLNKIVLMGAFFLSIVAVLPLVLNVISGGLLNVVSITGSTLLIVVGVILETVREIEAQMTMRHYKGFLK